VSRYGPRVFGRAPIAAGWCVLSAIPPIANSLGVSNEAEEVEFAVDSSLEGDGFEPSVPVAGEPVYIAEGELRADRRGSQKNLAGYRWFESISLLRGVRCELDPTASANYNPGAPSCPELPDRRLHSIRHA
jgi:hypothetical protein